MNIFVPFRAELLKTKKTVAIYHTLISASLIPLIFTLNIFTDGLPDETDSLKDPLNAIFLLSGQMNTIIIFPVFVIIICSLLAQIEYRNQTWKQVFASPQSKLTIFVSKFLTLQLMIILFIVATHLLMWLIAVIAHYKLADLDILHQPLDYVRVLKKLLTMYVATLALSTIQFLLALRLRNFIVPLAIGLGLWLSGTLMVLEYHSPAADYFPYSFPAKTLKPGSVETARRLEWNSLAWTAAALIFGFLNFRRSEKG